MHSVLDGTQQCSASTDSFLYDRPPLGSVLRVVIRLWPAGEFLSPHALRTIAARALHPSHSSSKAPPSSNGRAHLEKAIPIKWDIFTPVETTENNRLRELIFFPTEFRSVCYPKTQKTHARQDPEHCSLAGRQAPSYPALAGYLNPC